MVSILKLFLSRLTVKTLSQARRIIKIVIGFTLLLVGIALIFLPGPATVVIPLALAILAGEFLWAKRLLDRFNAGVKHLWPLKR